MTRAILAFFFILGAATVLAPPPVQRAEAWLRYRLLREVPAPILIGRHGRLFLANNEGSPPGSLITDICGGSVDDVTVARAAANLRQVLDAARATGVPARFVIVPTAPRLYPEDLPPAYAHACDPPAVPAADRLVAVLHDPAVVYPVAQMLALKPQFDVIPRKNFHWAGESPLHVAEAVADGLGLKRSLTLPFRRDNRASDLDQFDPGLGAHSLFREPYLRKAGVTLCYGVRCTPPIPDQLVTYTRPGPGRILVMGNSFGDEFGQAFTEYAGEVWLLRMNYVLSEPPNPKIAAMLGTFHPDAIVMVYNDAGVLGDAASQASFAAVRTLLANIALRPAAVSP